MKSLVLTIMGLLALAFGSGCGPRSATAYERHVEAQSEIVDDGGASPFLGRLSFKAPESMAIQEARVLPGGEGARTLAAALEQYRHQWTFLLTVGPKPGVKEDPQVPFKFDIENNGGMWGDHARNLQRLMFEMGPFIRLRMPDGREVEPSLVEYQRSFGMGKDRSWVVVFPKYNQGKMIKPPFEIRVKEFGQGIGTLMFQVKEAPGEVPDWKVRRMWEASRRTQG